MATITSGFSERLNDGEDYCCLAPPTLNTSINVCPGGPDTIIIANNPEIIKKARQLTSACDFDLTHQLPFSVNCTYLNTNTDFRLSDKALCDMETLCGTFVCEDGMPIESRPHTQPFWKKSHTTLSTNHMPKFKKGDIIRPIADRDSGNLCPYNYNWTFRTFETYKINELLTLPFGGLGYIIELVAGEDGDIGRTFQCYGEFHLDDKFVLVKSNKSNRYFPNLSNA